MAYKPSLRRSQKLEPMSLDIRPVMNLMVVLIPLLLAGSVFTKLAIKQLNLPPKSAGGGGGEEEKPAEIEKRLGLSVIISKRGFFIASRSGFLQADERKKEEDVEPSISLDEEGRYNFEALQAKLIEIKQKVIETDYSDKKSIIITAEADVAYKFLIKTMDFVTIYTDKEGNEQELFPQVIIGQVVI